MSEKLSGKIQSITDEQVTVGLINGKEVILPKNILPAEFTVGSDIWLTLSSTEKDDLAKDVLNEILHVQDSKEANGY